MKNILSAREVENKLNGMARRRDHRSAIDAAYSLGYAQAHETMMQLRIQDLKDIREGRMKP